MACSNCTNTSTSNTGCNCGSLGCPTSLQDKCVTISKSLDVCGEKTIPAGTSLDTVLKDTLSELCQLIDDASGATGPQGPTGATGATGAAGADGADGKGISSIVDNGDGTMTITYTDASTTTVPFIDTNKYYLLHSDVTTTDVTSTGLTTTNTYKLLGGTVSNDNDRIIISGVFSATGQPYSGFSVSLDGTGVVILTTSGTNAIIPIATNVPGYSSAHFKLELVRTSNTTAKSFLTISAANNTVVTFNPTDVNWVNFSTDTIIRLETLLSSSPVLSGQKITTESFKVEYFKQ